MSNNELLSQDEIDALLSGVDSGDVETESDDSPEQDAGVNNFDFGSQDRIVRGRMPTLEMINERFARNLRTSVFKLLKRTPSISVEGIQMTKFGEYVHTLLTPSSLNLVKVDPLRGTGLIIFDPKLVFSLVDCFFGGDGTKQSKVEGREFTGTEMRIVRRLLDDCFKDLEEAWSSILDIKFAYQGSEINPMFANIVSASEVVAVSSFNIDLEIGSGEIHIAMPYSMLEPIRDLLDAGMQSEAAEKDPRWGARLHDEIKTAPVTLTSTLTKTKLTVRDVLNMKKGDVISINLPDTVVASVKDVPVFRAKYGTSRGNVALKVDEFLDHSEVTPTEIKMGVMG